MASYTDPRVMPSAPNLPEHVFDRIPVVLLGGVNLVRALGLAGIPAIVATAKEDEPALASRHCTARCVIPSPAQGDAAVDALVSIGDRLVTLYGRRAPLFYGSDEWLTLIYSHRERLERYFLLLLNDPQVADAMLTKDGFQAFARRRGLPVPAALRWEGDGPASVASYPGPVVVKPSNKDGWTDSLLRKRAFGRAKALVFPSGADANDDIVLAHFRDQLTVQQYVSGDDRSNWSFHGFSDEKGHVIESFVGRKISTCPPDNGESAYIELEHNEELTALGKRLAACIPLKGVFKMDFKQDERTGRWYLLEVNARCNLWQYLGAVNGVNLMRTAYDFLLEAKRPAASAYGTRTRWLSLELDARAFRTLRAEGRLGVVRWLASILFARKVYNLFAWKDPGPWLSFWIRRLARLGTRAPARFLNLVRQWRSTAS